MTERLHSDTNHSFTKQQYERIRTQFMSSLPPFSDADANRDHAVDPSDLATLIFKVHFAINLFALLFFSSSMITLFDL